MQDLFYSFVLSGGLGLGTGSGLRYHYLLGTTLGWFYYLQFTGVRVARLNSQLYQFFQYFKTTIAGISGDIS